MSTQPATASSSARPTTRASRPSSTTSPTPTASSAPGTTPASAPGPGPGIKCVQGKVIAITLPWRRLGGRLSERIGQLTISAASASTTTPSPGPSPPPSASSPTYAASTSSTTASPAPSLPPSAAQLQSFDASCNLLTGAIPPSIANSTKLIRLNLSCTPSPATSQLRVGKMRKKKSGSDHTGSLNKRQKACKSGRKSSVLHLDSTFEEQFGSLHNSGQGVWSELSKEVASDLSRSVVSLALFDGSTMLFACTGIAIGRELHTTRLHTTRFLTSACLVRAFNDARNIDDNLRIEVRLPSNETAKGYLGLYDRDIAVVHRAHLHRQVQSGPHTMVVAAGRAFNSGSLMATSGMLIDRSSGLYCEQLMISTCKITKAGHGGPLIDANGNFVGMNLYCGTEKTRFLPWSLILQRLGQFQIFSAGNKQGGDCTRKKHTDDIQKASTPCDSYLAGSSSGEIKNNNQEASLPSDSIPRVSSVVPSGYMAEFKLLDSLGYPRPSLDMIEFCLILLKMILVTYLLGRVPKSTFVVLGTLSGENLIKLLLQIYPEVLSHLLH